MRIIAGSRKGARLFTPETKDIRPTPDMVRESLFNVIGQDMSGVCFLDLFAGTGAVGLEAVSRGAGTCVLVDNGYEAVALCRKNIQRLGFERRVEVLHMDAARAVAELAAGGFAFDAIFAGPPFHMKPGELEDLSADLAGSSVMADGCIFAIQLPLKIKQFKPRKFVFIKEKKYGKNRLLFFIKNPSSNFKAIPV
jgi:16S rRNA (guanine966-N2)-methyltransferase